MNFEQVCIYSAMNITVPFVVAVARLAISIGLFMI